MRAPARVCPGYLTSPRPCWCLCVMRPFAQACPANRAAPMPTAGHPLPPCPQCLRGDRPHPLPQGQPHPPLSPHQSSFPLPATPLPFPHKLHLEKLRKVGLPGVNNVTRVPVLQPLARVPWPVSPAPGGPLACPLTHSSVSQSHLTGMPPATRLTWAVPPVELTVFSFGSRIQSGVMSCICVSWPISSRTIAPLFFIVVFES